MARFVELESGERRMLVNVDQVVAALPNQHDDSVVTLMFLSGNSFKFRGQYADIKRILQAHNKKEG